MGILRGRKGNVTMWLRIAVIDRPSLLLKGTDRLHKRSRPFSQTISSFLKLISYRFLKGQPLFLFDN
jgi:hypothetical protein